MKSRYKIIFIYLIFIFQIKIIFTGIIEPDDILPLEISPSYTNSVGEKGTYFIFRFNIPNHLDKDSMPTMRGYGAANGQYIGIQFTPSLDYDTTKIIHSCEINLVEKNLDINLIPLNDDHEIASGGNNKVLYCKVDSYSNENLILPGYNYKLTLTFLDDVTNINNLISVTIFTSTSPYSDENEIIDIGTFNHINIIPSHNPSNQLNSIAKLDPVESNLNCPVESDINFDVKIEFNSWFSWDDYIICIKSQIQILKSKPL